MDGRTTWRGRLAGAVVRTVARNTAWAVAVLAAWSAVAALAPVTTGLATSRPEPAGDRVAVLVARHDCWTGAAPATAPEPSRAVVTLPHQRSRVVPAGAGYRIWLEGRPGVVHAFCP